MGGFQNASARMRNRYRRDLFRQSEPIAKSRDARVASKKREFRAIQRNTHPHWTNAGQMFQLFHGSVPVSQSGEGQSELEVAATVRVERRGLRHKLFGFRPPSRPGIGDRQITPIAGGRWGKKLLDKAFGGRRGWLQRFFPDLAGPGPDIPSGTRHPRLLALFRSFVKPTHG